jgi:hypothetical protein
MEPPSIQSPFARCRRYLHRGDVFRPPRSLCSLRSAPAASGMFPTLSLRIFLQMPDPMPRRSHEVHLPVSSFVSSAFPRSRMGRLPASDPRTRLFADRLFEAADIPLCSGLQICSPPRSFPPLRLQPQGGRGFDIRAERASFASARTGSTNRPSTGN